MEVASCVRHHFARLAAVERLEHFGRPVAHDNSERLEQRGGLGHFEKRLRLSIKADDAPLVINDDDRVLHVLEHGLVSQRRAAHDLLAKDYPGIKRQHQCKYERHERYRVRP